MASFFDMHIHTTAGSPDSSLSPRELLSEVRRLGLTGAVVTEHNGWPRHEFEDFARDLDIVLIRANEVYTNMGHIITLGQDKFAGMVTSVEDLRKAVDDVGGFMIIAHPFEQQMACMDLCCGGVLDTYPRLHIAILESGGGWLPYWLARLDEFAEKIGHMLPPLRLKPSEYFYRQCFLSCEPDDVALKTATALGTDQVLMWASDYPHFDCVFPGVVDELKEHCATLPDSAQANIMSDNAARCYGLH